MLSMQSMLIRMSAIECAKRIEKIILSTDQDKRSNILFKFETDELSGTLTYGADRLAAFPIMNGETGVDEFLRQLVQSVPQITACSIITDTSENNEAIKIHFPQHAQVNSYHHTGGQLF
jgi:hypothetical protein